MLSFPQRLPSSRILKQLETINGHKITLMTETNIRISGPPRCGKSILIEKVVSRIERQVTGFFTREIKGKGRRVGFSINTLDGKEGILA